MTSKKYSLTGYYKEPDDTLWLWDDLPEANMEVGYKVDALLHYERSPYQEISIVDTKGFGRMLVLDGTPQVTTKDGFIYNEMIAHIAMAAHPAPKKVAVIGGGDCGAAREALRYEGVQQIDVVEIDQRVVEVSRTWLTKGSVLEQDKRVHMIYRDGFKWIQEQKGAYDVVLVDRSDPYGPATSLYKQQFYQYLYDSLKDDGIVVLQSGSPYYNANILKSTVGSLKKRFPLVLPYLCTIPTFPGGIWSFTLGSKQWNPLQTDLNRLRWQEASYINPDTFRAAFTLPTYVKKIF